MALETKMSQSAVVTKQVCHQQSTMVTSSTGVLMSSQVC